MTPSAAATRSPRPLLLPLLLPFTRTLPAPTALRQGFRLLMKMGWKEGESLGAEGSIGRRDGVLSAPAALHLNATVN